LFDDVAAIFYNNVVSAYEDYVAHRDSGSAGRDAHLRSAIEAATALFHFREHLPAGRQMSRGQVEKDCSDFQLVADVVNATKHRKLTKGRPFIKSAEDVQEYTVITRYADEQGEYSHVRTVVQVRCLDGTTRNLDLALTNVLNYWGGKLKEWGIVEYAARPVRVFPGARHVGRDEARSLNLEILKGLRFHQNMQLLKFNYDRGHVEPVDLTGAKMEFRIYKPRYELNLTFTRRNTGQTIEVPFRLSEEESMHVHGLQTKEEQQEYLQQLINTRRDEINAAASAALAGAAKEVKP
jgi:hypothetical protein